MSEVNLTSKRVIKQGLLMKRCRWCWRPRFIEIISDPPDFTGPLYSFFLLIFDQSHRNVKKAIRIQDIVTIRSGKRNTFQVYLNNGMFILFRTESMEAQGAWMAELKMALGRGNIYHVQVSTPADNFVLDHALLYCIGVNLPNHHIGQLDRVLVVASAINDVNLHAWNLSRVKRFMVIEAGIQMELCGNCMGHRKKTVTFLISPEFIQDCVDFLVKEARMPNEPKRMAGDGPLYYSLPHSCSVVAESSGSTPCPTYTNAEMIVLGKDNKQLSASTGLYINYDGRGRSFSTTVTQTAHGKSKSTSPHPSLPPRGVWRATESTDDSVSPPTLSSPLKSTTSTNNTTTTSTTTTSMGTTATTTSTTTTAQHFDHVPYQIDHRIYVNERGRMTEDTHVFGSDTWEHNGRSRRQVRPPLIPPRVEERESNIVYLQDNDINTPTAADPTNGTVFQRPEFIGRNPPCLPPRGMESSPILTHRSTSDSNLLVDQYTNSGHDSPSLMRRSSEHPVVPRSNVTVEMEYFDGGSSTQPDPMPEKHLYQNISTNHGLHDLSRSYSCSYSGPSTTGAGYVNQQMIRSPSPQMCTDDISNAEFALITEVHFSGSVLPPRNQQRSSRRPVPVPRNRKPDQQKPTSGTEEPCVSPPLRAERSDSDLAVENKEKADEEKDVIQSVGPMYLNVGVRRLKQQTTPSDGSLPQRFDQRCNSFSSTSLSSDDYKKPADTDLQRRYPHEV